MDLQDLFTSSSSFAPRETQAPQAAPIDDVVMAPPSSLSNFQEIFLTLIPIPFTLLSIFGSVTIICMAYKTRRFNKWSTYTRLLVAMSCNDIIFSATYGLGAFLLPKETSARLWAFGNEATCSAVGTLMQFAYSGVMYNGMLSYYFLLAAKYGWKRRIIARRVEPLMHIVSLGYPLATAIAGAVLGVYHETELGVTCWVANYPENCGDGPGGTGEPCKSTMLAYIFGGGMVFFVLCSLLFNNVSILLFVRKQVPPEWRKQWNAQKVGTPECEVFNKPNDKFLEDLVVAKSTQAGDDFSRSKDLSTGDVETPKTLVAIGERQGSSGGLSSGTSGDRSMNEIDPCPCIQQEQVERLQLVAQQSYLYVGAFLITVIWPVMLRILESLDYNKDSEDKLFVLLLLQQVLFPIQGLLNLLVYARPKYLKWRREFPEESRLFAFRRAVYGDEVKPPGRSKGKAGHGNPAVGKGCTAVSADSPANFNAQRQIPMATRRELRFDTPPAPKTILPQSNHTPEKQRSGSNGSSRGSSSSNKHSGSSTQSKQGLTLSRLLPRALVSSLTASEGDFAVDDGLDKELGLGAPPARKSSLTSGWTAIRLTGALISSLTASGTTDNDNTSETELEGFDQSMAPPAVSSDHTNEKTEWVAHDTPKHAKGSGKRVVYYSDLSEPLESVVENPYEDEADESSSLGSSSRKNDRFEVGGVESSSGVTPPRRRNTLTNSVQCAMPSVEAVMVIIDDESSSDEFIDPTFDRMDVTNHCNGTCSSLDAPLSIPSRESSSSEHPDITSNSSDIALKIPIRMASSAETPDDQAHADRIDNTDQTDNRIGGRLSSALDGPISAPTRHTSIAKQTDSSKDGPVYIPFWRASVEIPPLPPTKFQSNEAPVRLPTRQASNDPPPNFKSIDIPMRVRARQVSTDPPPGMIKETVSPSSTDASMHVPTRPTSSAAVQPPGEEDLRMACYSADLSASQVECLGDVLARY